MKEFKLKIYNPEVVDCSSTWAHLTPPIESIELLLDILLELLKSDLIVNIGIIELTLDFGADSPYTTYKSPEVLDKYFFDVLDYDLNLYDLLQGSEAEENRLNELYIERKEKTEVRTRKNQEELDKKYPQKYKSFILPPGVKGVMQAIRIIQDLNLGSVKFGSIYVDIIWKTWIHYYNSTPKERIIFDLIRDDEEVLESIDEIKDLDLNIRKRVLKAFSHIGFELEGGLGFSAEMSLGKNYRYITQKHYDEILSFLKMKFNKQFKMGFAYG
ncbi:hypothetical protein LCGC14_1661700 [marine sediment metagenome]|uniref:Uncharacterized protein n=1 Tax=marine sediment metagenome TaxID=412755 RepID=A0A0F9K9R9_9ZZZZ